MLNGGNATGTPDGVNQVEGSSLICNAGQGNQTIFTTTPVPLDARGNADFHGTFGTKVGTCGEPPLSDPNCPGDLLTPIRHWIATGAVRIGGQ